MTIEISKEARKEAIASIDNKAVTDLQERVQMRVMELDIEMHEDEFRYWRKFDRPRKGPR
jgi:hypothetical protein